MHSISAGSKQIQDAFKQYNFAQGDDFSWSPSSKTLVFPALERLEDLWSLLHEIGHAELHHTAYKLDIALIRCEALAWDHAAQVLAPRFNLQIDENYIQDHLDTYRDWLHRRSLCPTCGQNGVQTQNTYRCLNCRCLWRTNEARLCRLQRIRLQVQSRS